MSLGALIMTYSRPLLDFLMNLSYNIHLTFVKRFSTLAEIEPGTYLTIRATVLSARPGACVIKLIFQYYGHMTVIRKNHHVQNISVFKAWFLRSI